MFRRSRDADLNRIERVTETQNIPLWFGEWSISTNFDATDEFMKQWGDAQKLQYSKSTGWIVSLLRPTRNAQVVDYRSSSSSGASKLRIPRLLVTCGSNGMGVCRPFVELKLILRFTRSYYKGIELGYLTEDPAAYHDPNVCVPYIGAS